MAKKLEKCCFCNKASVAGNINKWGAFNQDTDKYLCLECVIGIFEGIMDEIKQKWMDESVKTDE